MSLSKVAQNDNQSPVGLMELLQTPCVRRQTGALVIDGPDDHVRLYYVHGELVHAGSASFQGLDALVQVLGWPGGDAEFLSGALCDLRTIHVDITRALQLALRTLDARARSAMSPPSLEQQPGNRPSKPAKAPRSDTGQAAARGPRTGRARTRQPATPTERVLDTELCVQLAEYVVGSGFARYACIMREGGAVQAEAGMESAVEGVAGLRVALGGLIASHGRPGLDRVVIEDRLGTIVLVGMNHGRALLVLGDRHPEVGGVLDGVSRLAAALARHQQ